jgi:NitT/TauT family transport system ATP-binding protein
VGLEKFETNLPRELSGGMQMRASIARGAGDRARPCCSMDEPFGRSTRSPATAWTATCVDLWAASGADRRVRHALSIYEAVYLSNRRRR